MGTVTEKKLGLSSASLRYLALFLMLVDHIWLALLRPEQFWMTCMGRLAFPIFAFLIAEGFYHTSSRRKYAFRLLIAGVISEIPYNVFIKARFFAPGSLNVMFTLLFGLLALWVFRWAVEKGGAKRYLLSCMGFAALYVAADYLHSSYGGLGVTMVVMFGLLRHVKYEVFWQLLCLVVINYFVPGRTLTIGGVSFSIQNFATLALIPIRMYNGARGKKNKFLQYGAYLFYPAHMGILAILRWLL